MTRRATAVSDAELRARAADLAVVPEPEDVRDPNSVLVVRLRAEAFSIVARQVREIVSHPVVTPLPAAPPFVAGVMNLRGDIIAVIDPTTLLGLAAAQPPARFAIVVEHHDLRAALLVDSVDDISATGAATAIDVAKMLLHPDLLPPDDVVVG